MSGTFDTLTAARKLEAAGMDRKQAEAIADVVRAGQGRAGQGEFARRDGLAALHKYIPPLEAIAVANLAVAWFILVFVLVKAFQP